MCQFARADWTAQANHGLRKDFEDKLLLFPAFDQLTLGLTMDSEGQDILNTDLSKNLYDNKTECILEIEELKNELTTIVMSQTSTSTGARDRWDTPEVKLDNGKKGRLRKDRYSSLVMANMLARQMNRQLAPVNYDVIGGNTQYREKARRQYVCRTRMVYERWRKRRFLWRDLQIVVYLYIIGLHSHYNRNEP